MNYDKDRYIGYVEQALGVGDMIGPALGGLIFEFVGFAGTFFMFGALIFLGTLLSVIWIPNRLNKVSTSTDKLMAEDEVHGL
jgi:MFS family permease